MTVTTLIIALISVLMSIVIAIGKGDWLIAGYNTSSKEEKEKVNIKRLRLLTSISILPLKSHLRFCFPGNFNQCKNRADGRDKAYIHCLIHCKTQMY